MQSREVRERPSAEEKKVLRSVVCPAAEHLNTQEVNTAFVCLY